jgi:DNA-directed RNA polymerase subunit RPC12/RpoP
MIQHRCPQCGRELRTNEHLAGLTIVCPECRERIPVPGPDAGKPPDAIQAERPAGAPAPVELTPAPEPLPLGPRPRDPLLIDEPWPGPQYLPPPPRRGASWYALLAGVGAAVLAAVCGIAWLIAGSPAWKWILIGGGILVGFPAASLLWGWVKSGFRAEEGRNLAGWLPLILYAAVLCVAWGVIGHTFAWGTVHVDNFSGRPVRIDVDGQEWMTSQAGTTEVRGLRRGKHTVTVRAPDTGEELDRFGAEVAGVETYVLNVLRAQVYARGTAQYGGLAFLGPPPEEAVRLPWFKAEVDYLFQEPPQTITVSVRRGEVAVGTSKTYLVRRPPQPPKRPGFGL